MEFIRQNVENYLDNNNVTKGALANRIGISRSTLYEKLDGNRPWLLDEAIALSELIGCTIDDLVNKQLPISN